MGSFSIKYNTIIRRTFATFFGFFGSKKAPKALTNLPLPFHSRHSSHSCYSRLMSPVAFESRLIHHKNNRNDSLARSTMPIPMIEYFSVLLSNHKGVQEILIVRDDAQSPSTRALISSNSTVAQSEVVRSTTSEKNASSVNEDEQQPVSSIEKCSTVPRQRPIQENTKLPGKPTSKMIQRYVAPSG